MSEQLVDLATGQTAEVQWITHDGRGLPIAPPFEVGVSINGSALVPLRDIQAAADQLQSRAAGSSSGS